jgi:hypothetical protein
MCELLYSLKFKDQNIILSWVNHDHKLLCLKSVRIDDQEENYFLIDVTNGNQLAEYPLIGGISEGLIEFGTNRMNFGFLNLKGEVEIQPCFSFVDSFSDGLALTFRNGESDQYIDKDGNVVLDLGTRSGGQFRSGFAIAEDQNHTKYFVIDRQGEEIFTMDSKNTYLQNLGDGLFMKCVNGKYDVIDVKL